MNQQEPSSSSNQTNKGVEKIVNSSRSFWKKQNISFIKVQAELRGHRFSDMDTKGGNKTVKGNLVKVKRFTKEDYLNILYKLLKI